MIDTSRILATETGETYSLRSNGRTIAAFRTEGVNGRTADATAIGNGMDASEQTPDPVFVYRQDYLIATCTYGAARVHNR